MSEPATEDELAEAVEAVMRSGGASAGIMLLRMMLRNAEERERNWQWLFEGEQAAHERTRAERDEAWDKLDRITKCVAWLFDQGE